MVASTAISVFLNTSVATALDTGPTTLLPSQAGSTMIQAMTTVAPSGTDSTVIAVVIVLILLTLAALGILLYRYLCHNKGDYRTTGELAPGEDPEADYSNQDVSEKKEYFI